jgi:hypothetical protein
MAGHSGLVSAAGTPRGARAAAPRGALALIAAGTLIGLAACGSAVSGGAGIPVSAGTSHPPTPAAAVSASAGVPLCAAAQSVDRVVAGPMSSHFREVLPRGITISDAPRVRALAAALCALPPMPSGLHCPAAIGGTVRLVFAAGGQDFQPVAIQESGCRAVSGIGPARWWSRSPQFGQLLTRTVGGRGRLIPGTHPSSVPTA